MLKWLPYEKEASNVSLECLRLYSVTLTLSALGIISEDDILKYFSNFFFHETEFDI